MPLSLWQHGTQAKLSNKAKTNFYQISVRSPTWLESLEHPRRQ